MTPYLDFFWLLLFCIYLHAPAKYSHGGNCLNSEGLLRVQVLEKKLLILIESFSMEWTASHRSVGWWIVAGCCCESVSGTRFESGGT